MPASSVINVVANPSQPVAAAIQPGPGVQLVAQQPSATSAVSVVLSQPAVVSRLIQPSVSAVTASPAGYCIVYENWKIVNMLLIYILSICPHKPHPWPDSPIYYYI